MPIYEYQCAKCQHHLEALQKISDKPLRECPECGKHTLKRLVSAPMFRLAGSGWYETDFKSDKETKRNLAGREESAGDSGSKDAEAKPADKADKPAPKTEGSSADGARKTMVTRPATKPVPARVAAARPAAKSARKPAPKKPASKKAVRKR
jgi:putative FmdB family regulatory protein